MYNVSNEFKNAMLSPAQEHRLTGTIGSISFDESNIVEGSFQIQNQCTKTDDVVLGSVFVGELTAEIVGIDFPYGDWIGKTITPTFALKVGNNWESVPLGIFKVKEANHTAYGVQITAYDNMIKFDKKFKKSHFQFTAIGTYPFIEQICTDCNVTLANTEAEIEAMPNGQRVLEIYGAMGKKSEFANDIETYRDLLFWVAQTMGCFATINRAGQLEFRKYTQTVVDEINEQHRLTGATFADYITHYVGIYVENLDTNTFDYYGYDAEALQQELDECIEEANQILDDMEEVQRKYDAHEITEEEYNAQMKALQKAHKKLLKRMSWLEKALQQADDGASMDLGANPLLCDSNLTTRDAERRAVLKSLDAISYTPFSASCVHGVIYDLGDVIQFSGGLYNSENDSFGCVMSWTYTHNGGTELEGFGVDPAVQLVRTKTQKSADKANTNAITALKENDLVFDIDPDTNEVVATNKKVFSQTAMTRKWKMWEYNLNISDAVKWSKWDTSLTMDHPFVLCTWPDLDHGSPRYCTFNGKTYQSMCLAAVTRLSQDVGDHFVISQSWTCYAGNSNIGYNWFSDWAYKRNNLLYYYSGTAVGTLMYGVLNIEPEYTFNSLQDFFYAMDSGAIEIPGVVADDECVMATEATAKQAAANIEYVVEKMKGNNPTRDSESYSGNVNLLSEKTMQRLADAFYDIGNYIGNPAYINVFTGATDQANGSKGLVPAPLIADRAKFLCGDGTWKENSGGGASAIADLTDVELDNLSDGQILKYNNTAQKWENANESGGGSAELLAPTPFIYSEDEEQVGVWVDGKPLYAKTKSFTNVSKSGSLSFGVADAETVFIKDIGKASDSIPIPYVYGSAPSNNIGGFLTKTSSDVIWEFRSGNDAPSTLSGFMTLLYTKTTDTPWQGGFKAYGFSPVIYSDTEREIGVYTDGKPLYQKTYSGLSVSLGADWVNAIDISSLNVDKCIDGIGVASSGYQTPLCTKINGNYLQIYMNGMAGITISALTIKYTKSTDTAGSGKYTTLGTPTVHYDGEERVIGTWFGETLYRKTVDIGSDVYISNSTWYTSGISITNVSMIISCNGVNSSGTYYPLNAYRSGSDINLLACRDGNPANVHWVTFEYTKSSS